MPEARGSEKFQNIIKSAKKRKEHAEQAGIEVVLVKVVVFSLCNRLYAFFGKHIKNILPHTVVTFVPGCPDYIAGIINVRGDIESVINIHSFLRLQDTGMDENGRIVIAEASGMRSGIHVDSVEDVIDFPQTDIAAPVSTLDEKITPFVAGELFYRDMNVTLLSVDKLFATMQQAGK